MRVANEAAIVRLEERLDADDIHGLWIIFHDYSGRACVKWAPKPAIATALRTGGVFAKANLNFTIDDVQVEQPRFGADTGDFFAVPDPDTYTRVPYRPGIGRVFSYLCTEDGKLWEGCPRGRLNAALAALAARGYSLRAAYEPEFTLYRETDDGWVAADRFAMYSLDRVDAFHTLLERINRALLEQSVRVVQIGSEYGAGQLEVNLHHETPLKAADDLATLRETVKAIARDEGYLASFMPKPFEDSAGNGLHIHLSLWSADGAEDRSEGDDPDTMSTPLLHFIGGLLAHAPAICGVGAPTVNSYKRLQPASWAPAHIAFGSGNRSALVRIPGRTRNRIEFRAGDNTSNPYLFLTALVSAGIDGMDRELDPGTASQFDLGHATAELLLGEGVDLLPRTAREALNAVEHDQVILDGLGSICGPEFLRVKWNEFSRYSKQVSEWERQVYFERI
jgi:glutamine synthetase